MLTYEAFLEDELKDPAFAEAYYKQALPFAIAKAVIRLRIERNLTQADLARLVGTKQSAISRIESGEHMPSLTFVAKIAQALGADIEIAFKVRETSGIVLEVEA